MTRIGFALIPTASEYFFSLAENLASKLDLSFFIERGKTIPHVSLFQGVFLDEEKVLDAFTQFSFSKKLATQATDGISVWATKIIFLNLKLTSELQSAHQDIFTLMSPLSTGRSADPQVFKGITDGQQKSFIETGYPFSQKEYQPHMTLGHLAKAKTFASQYTSIIKNDSIITFEKIIIFRVGDKGICHDILYEHVI